MGKRALTRHRTKASVACNNLATWSIDRVFEGGMLNLKTEVGDV